MFAVQLLPPVFVIVKLSKAFVLVQKSFVPVIALPDGDTTQFTIYGPERFSVFGSGVCAIAGPYAS